MIYLRRACAEDVDLIFRWANDPLTRANAFSTEQIAYTEHVRWFEGVMNSRDAAMFIMMDDDNPVGQVRIDIDGSVAEIDYSIAPELRSQGYGQKIIGLLSEKVSRDFPDVCTLSAKVKPENVPSRKVFEAEGYTASASRNPIVFTRTVEHQCHPIS